ncbi:MAG TPA: NUDIX hydrolase [Acidimicrobiales bacterium]|jgi:ADP-ribose pyrophosphatase
MAGFRQTSEEELLRAWIFKVHKVYVEDPSGQIFDRFVIRHPGAVAVVPLHDDGTVSLVRQYRAPVDAMVLEIPAGTRDRKESLLDTAHRELAEECGLAAASLEELLGTWNTPGISDQETWLYLATGLTEVESRPDGIEEDYMTIEKIHLDQVDELVADGSIKDESTVLGLYVARARYRGS